MVEHTHPHLQEKLANWEAAPSRSCSNGIRHITVRDAEDRLASCAKEAV